jgi:hypothetical protein
MSIIDIEVFYELLAIFLGFYFCSLLLIKSNKQGVLSLSNQKYKNQQKNHLLDNILDSKIDYFTAIFL